MFARTRSALLLSALVLTGSLKLDAQAAATPAKIAVVDMQKAVGDTQQMKTTLAGLEAKYKPRQQAIQSLQTQLQSIQQQLNAPNIAPDRESQLRADFGQKQKQLQRLSDDLQSDVNNEQQDILGRVGREMADIIKKIAEQRGLDVVLFVNAAIYIRPTLDITIEATAEFDKAHPVAGK